MSAGESIYNVMEQHLPEPIADILRRYHWGSARWWPLRDTIRVDLAAAVANPFDSLVAFKGNPDQAAPSVNTAPNSNSSPRGSVFTNMQEPGSIDSNTAYIGVGMAIVPNLAISDPAAADLYTEASEVDRVQLLDESRLIVRINGVHNYESVRTRECARNPTTAESLTTTARIAPKVDQELDGILFYSFRDDLVVLRPQSTFDYQLQWSADVSPARVLGEWWIEAILYGYLVENVQAQRGDS